MKNALLVACFTILSSGLVRAQSTADQVAPILKQPIESPQVVTFQLQEYLMQRATPLPPVPKSAQEWTAEAARIRERVLSDVIFHGWPESVGELASEVRRLGRDSCFRT